MGEHLKFLVKIKKYYGQTNFQIFQPSKICRFFKFLFS